MTKIHYYISSHGFGHSTRAIEVINHIPSSVEVEIITSAPQWLFERSLTRPFEYRSLQHDAGILQIDCFKNDQQSTYDFWLGLLDDYPRMAEEEAGRFKGGKNLVVGDISPFAVAVAQTVGIPSVIVANFSWNWIFEVFLDQNPAFQGIIDRISDYYSECPLLLRTPLSGDLSVFPQIRDIPLIVRRSSMTREESRHHFGINQYARVVLVSFGGMGMNAIKPDFLETFRDITFLTFDDKLTGPANVRYLHPQDTYHPDAIRASDLALAKMGYGIVTECIAHQVPIAYPPRNGFPEHPVLVEQSQHWIEAFAIAEDDFNQGNWGFLEDFFTSNMKRNVKSFPVAEVDGGRIAAEILCSMAV